MSYYYVYIPRDDPEPPKAEEAINPWVASPPSPAVVAAKAMNAWAASPPSPAVVASKGMNAWAASPPSPAVVASKAMNAWVASPPSPVVAPPAEPAPAAAVYYASAPVPEPVKHNFWYGHTKSEIEAKKPKPEPVVAQVTGTAQQFYCRELDGSYTLRTPTEIMEKLQPGFWTHASSGWPYWVRTK